MVSRPPRVGSFSSEPPIDCFVRNVQDKLPKAKAPDIQPIACMLLEPFSQSGVAQPCAQPPHRLPVPIAQHSADDQLPIFVPGKIGKVVLPEARADEWGELIGSIFPLGDFHSLCPLSNLS